ncbi:MAG: aminoglycoside 6-adenylyltransferase [Planctomycetes bacterium]|nr:aminoglycoside 6-adenylyltransferase [Planctomycetota bacterium]
MIHRDVIVKALTTTLGGLPHVRAAFLAGSQAFGRQDRYSDIDINCVTPLDQAEGNFAAVESTLKQLSPIQHQVEMPPSGQWPELAQRFYRLRDTDEFLMIDFCQMTPAQLQTFLDPVRHGTPVVLFDHDNLLRPVEPDVDAHNAAMRKRLQFLRASFPVFQNLVRKAVHRGDLLEAMAMWMGQTMRPLVEVLRMKHCPARYDYGFRYTTYDLPAAVAAELQELMWPKGAQDMLQKLDQAGALFEAVAAGLFK